MDEISLGWLFGLLVVLLVFSGFFSGSETSMMAINRYRLNNMVRKGSRSARLVNHLLGQVDKLLGSILFGNTLVNVIAAALVNIIILRLFGQNDLAILLGTLALTFVILVFSEIMPKILAASYPERIALPASYLLAPLITLFHPVVVVATSLVKGVLWLLRIRIETDQRKTKMTLEELRGLVLDAEHFLPRKHQKMLLNLVDLERVTVNDVMVPRSRIEALDINAAADDLHQQVITCHHTLLPVYEGAPNNIIGILHIKRAPALLQDGGLDVDELRKVLNEPYFIPSDTPLLRQLQQFQERHARLGLVVDEYGELLGLVTLETFSKRLSANSLPNPPRNPENFCVRTMAASFWKAAAACVS